VGENKYRVDSTVVANPHTDNSKENERETKKWHSCDTNCVSFICAFIGMEKGSDSSGTQIQLFLCTI